MAALTIAALVVGLLANGAPDILAVIALATIPCLCAWKLGSE